MKHLLLVSILAVAVTFLCSPAAHSREFTGSVTSVNRDAQILTVKGGGRSVTFDISNPILKGYRGLSSIKVGDKVSVAYTPQAIRITRGFGNTHVGETEKPVLRPEKKSVRKTTKDGRTRLAERKRGTDFVCVDENSDGRITPVELSVIMPGLTMEQFKVFDKNGDGCLDKSEFGAVGQRLTK